MKIDHYRVYIKPFDDAGNYGEWVDITSDVDKSSLSMIEQSLDNSEYDIGVFRSGSLNITLRNNHGRYSDVGGDRSVFRYKRSDSQIKITWETAEDGPYCGLVRCGEFSLSEEIDLFVGLINDDSLSMDLDQQKVSFRVLGRESIFARAVVPISSIANGDLVSEVILAILDQSTITDLLTVDSGNISLGTDQLIDSITDLETRTVQEALNTLLLISNSVIYIDGDSVIVAPRTATAEVQYNFYGQASLGNPENIQGIKSIKNGVARIFNYLSWSETATVSQDTSSVTKYGVRKRALSTPLITDSGKRSDILSAILEEFKDPKQEFDLYTPLNYQTVAIRLLDRMSIDYPTVYVETVNALPICGIAVCGEAVLPKAIWAFKLFPEDHYKIIGRGVDTQRSLMKFRMRAI